MLIGIDASRAKAPYITGVEFYSQKIISGMSEIVSKQKDHQVVFYTPSKLDIKQCPIIPKGVKARTFFETSKYTIAQQLIRPGRLWTQLKLAFHLLKDPPDVLFVPSHVFPHVLHKKVRAIITIHDIAFIFLSQAYAYTHTKYLVFTAKHASSRAYKIIVPSEATATDFAKVFNYPREKIKVIPHGAPQKELSEEKVPLDHYGLRADSKFILFIGRLEEKKNLSRTIRAFSRFAANHKEWKLVLAGIPGVGFSKILSTLFESPFRERILLPGYVNHQQKSSLYQSASLLVLPSLYEGFGLPILEAFHYNVPVVAANSSALPEVCADAAYLIDPFDEEALSQGIEQVALRDDLRNELIHAGKRRLRKFSWKKIAQKTWEELIS